MQGKWGSRMSHKPSANELSVKKLGIQALYFQKIVFTGSHMNILKA